MAENVKKAITDANEAVASVAYVYSEVVSIFPITPSSPMADCCDQWAANGKANLWGQVPEVIEMESEAGVAGLAHGTAQNGVLTTTFTASQGLLLMIPNLYKLAGELTPFCMHVTARALSTHALSIYGDQSDVMATRQTGVVLLASHSVQAAQDLAAVAHAATLKARIPFLHFFDGFRTSHEINTYVPLEEAHLKALLDEEHLIAFRERGLNPDDPMICGTAQMSDVYFQCAERANLFYLAVPEIVETKMRELETLTGRAYHLFEYTGSPDAERVFVAMGSGAETLKQTVYYLQQKGEKVGVINVHLYRPFSVKHFIQTLPCSVQEIIVLDRTKEHGSVAEPLCLDVIAALQEAVDTKQFPHLPKIIGGRYGVGMKEFTPTMANAVHGAAKTQTLKRSFTVGINDDVTHLSIPVKETVDFEDKDGFRALFFGLASDGTIGANKNTIKIIGRETEKFAQAYFVYDSKKSGGMTVSHLRFGNKPIEAPYLIQTSHFVGCHQFQFLHTYPVLKTLQNGGVFLLNAPFSPEELWEQLPRNVQQTLTDKQIRFYAIDAYAIAQKAGMGNRINTVMQTCFFAISGILPQKAAIEAVKQAIKKTYGKKGDAIVNANCAAVDATLENLHKIELQTVSAQAETCASFALSGASEFIQTVTRRLLEHRGDDLPVSALPIGGKWPTGTSCFEKRNMAQFIPDWDPELCGQCTRCTTVCPHAALRSKHFDPTLLQSAPDAFKSMPYRSKDFTKDVFTLQVIPEHCTGCGLCSESCLSRSRTDASKKALMMVKKSEIFEKTKRCSEFFDTLPYPKSDNIPLDAKQAQFRQPLFEFSGACIGCGDTPYIKLLTQLFGDRLLIANATGCSSIYSGHLPTTPYTKNADGRGPAWASSLFEDNAEFGLGMRVAADKKTHLARELLRELQSQLTTDFSALLQKPTDDLQRQQYWNLIAVLKRQLQALSSEKARLLLPIADFLVDRSVWTIGGDGWAYDIGYGGLDHVLASGRNVKILVLDTEVYSNTGGQQSKATPLGAVAKFAASGKEHAKKDLGLLAITYGNIYVAQIAIQTNPNQAVKAFTEAEAYDGSALIIAYSNCIEHGYDLRYGVEQQRLAVASGYWPLYRYDPRLTDRNPLQLDAVDTKVPLSEYLKRENRFQMLTKTQPKRAEQLLQQAQEAVHRRVAFYKKLAK